MIICTIPTSDCTPQTIVIGRRTTYDTLQVVFDLGYLVEAYGSGTAVLAVKRSQDETAYPAIITQDGNTLTWTISETDTYYVGAGECELMWYVNNGLAKTIIYPVVVMRDILQTAEEPPDGYENWIEQLTDLGAETLQNAQNAAQSASDAESAKDDTVTAKEAAEEAARKAEEASAHAPIIVNGYWYAWDATTKAYQNTGVKAEGRDGTDGFSPVITVTDITGGHRVTITDADGTQTVDVMNGTDGTDGDDGFSPTVTITTITGGHRVTITDKDGAHSFDVMDGEDGASDAGEVTYDDTATYPSGTVGAALTNQKNAIDQKAPVIINTASGDVASFADGADGMQIKKIVGTIVTPEGGSGWTGANICALSDVSQYYGKTLYYSPYQDGSGDPSPDNRRNIIPYTIQRDDGTLISTYGGRLDVNANGTSRLRNSWILYTFTGNESFSVSGGGHYRVYTTQFRSTISTSLMAMKCNVLPTVTTEETYNGTAVGISKDNNLDVQICIALKTVHTAKMVQDWIKATGDVQFVYHAYSYNGDYILSKRETMQILAQVFGKTIPITFTDPSTGDPMTIYSGTLTLNEDGSGDIVNSDSGNSYHLTNVGILSTFYGWNNIFIDTGAITECDYPADTKLYIDGLTAPDEDMVANANIASGKYFVVNNQLYLSTAAIAAGASIVPGTNCTATNIAAALNAINT